MVEKKNYIICTTARSGSNLVCDYFDKSRILGRPAEFLNPSVILKGAFGKRFNAISPVSVETYIKWLLENFRTENGIFGIKILYEDFEFLRSFSALRQLFDNSEIFLLSRRSKLRQAISYYIAESTGQWMSIDPARIPAEQVPFNYQAIFTHMKRLVGQDLQWRAFFESVNMKYSELIFEELIADAQNFMGIIYNKFGLMPQNLIINPTLEEQKTMSTNLFLEQYRKQAVEEYFARKDQVWYESFQFIA